MKRQHIFRIMVFCLLAVVWQRGISQDSLSTDTAKPALSAAPAADTGVAAAATIDLGKARTGRALFEGSMNLIHGGPSCITCHNVKHPSLVPGGLLAKDLTFANSRLTAAGVSGIITSTPFPAMAVAYKSKPITQEEADAIAAFLAEADSIQIAQGQPAGVDPAPDHSLLLLGGLGGAALWLGLLGLFFINRKRRSVKHDIYARQRH